VRFFGAPACERLEAGIGLNAFDVSCSGAKMSPERGAAK
jgi:hypothetical protein